MADHILNTLGGAFWSASAVDVGHIDFGASVAQLVRKYVAGDGGAGEQDALGRVRG